MSLDKIFLSVLVTGHKEGRVALPTLESIGNSVDFFQSKDRRKAEVIAVLDSANEETKSVFNEKRNVVSKIFESNFSDPGLARNFGVKQCRGEFIAIFDGDNLASENWLLRCFETNPNFRQILHPELELGFGAVNYIKRNVDQFESSFSPFIFLLKNYWDTFCLAHKNIFLETPYTPQSSEDRIGFEDWHWNMETLSKGFEHRTVSNTAHFRRNKKNHSVNRKAEERNSIVRESVFFKNLRNHNVGPAHQESESSHDLLSKSWFQKLRSNLGSIEPEILEVTDPSKISVVTPSHEAEVSKKFLEMVRNIPDEVDHLVLTDGSKHSNNSWMEDFVRRVKGLSQTYYILFTDDGRTTSDHQRTLILRAILQKNCRHLHVLNSLIGNEILQNYRNLISKMSIVSSWN